MLLLSFLLSTAIAGFIFFWCMEHMQQDFTVEFLTLLSEATIYLTHDEPLQ